MAGRYLPLFPAQRPSIKSLPLYPLLQMKKRKKVRAIKKVVATLPPGHIYAETNYMFGLTFYSVIMQHFTPVSVIVLRRFLPKVLKSFIDLDYFGSRGHTPYWVTSPNIQSAAVQALAPDKDLDRVDKCIGFLIDIEARAQRFKKNYPNAHVVEVRLESLNNLNNVLSLFEQLGVEATDETQKMVGEVANDKVYVKKDTSVTEGYCHERILQYIEKCEEKDIVLPKLPHLHVYKERNLELTHFGGHLNA
jgi:hypothetical protein